MEGQGMARIRASSDKMTGARRDGVRMGRGLAAR